MKLTVRQLSSAINAKLNALPKCGDYSITTACIDSRSVIDSDNTVFFALKTPGADGHDYIPYLYQKGVRVFVVDINKQIVLPKDAAILSVPSVLDALQTSACYIRSLFQGVVVAITGSSRKTVAKELLTSLLQDTVKVQRSPRSWNSQIGVPLSIWTMDKDSDVYILEAGVSSPGEMTTLEKIIRPDVGIFTGLTSEHSENFASSANHLAEKMLLFKNCKKVFKCDNSLVSFRKTLGEVARELSPALKNIHIPTRQITTRVDIVEADNGLIVAHDPYTTDTEGIITGIDVLRRRVPSGYHITAVLGDMDVPVQAVEREYANLEEALLRCGVSTVVALDSEIRRYAEKWSRVRLRTDIPEKFQTLIEKSASKLFPNQAVYINAGNTKRAEDVFAWLSSVRNVTRLEINLDNVAWNFNAYRALLPLHTGIIGMIKADAYGCGAREIARTLQSQGATMLAVAVVDEGIQLRRAGVKLPIIVLDPWCENLPSIFTYNLQPTIISPDPRVWSMIAGTAAEHGVETVHVHLKLDTGMHRLGFGKEQLPCLKKLLKEYPQIRIDTVFSHLATADCPDLKEYTDQQLHVFDEMVTQVRKMLSYPFKIHILNTAGIVCYGKNTKTDMVRLGIGMYGISPFPEGQNDAITPKTVASLTTRIISTQTYKTGDTIGYGCYGKIYKPSVIATLPIGYADGIDRRLGNGNTSFWVNGVLCPTVGNICMDLCMIDVTGVDNLTDATVEIFGQHIPIQRLSDTLGTIPYEVLVRISPRVRRVYFKE